ncbi:hypothetical protein V22_20080 [Calycomorphotria hydatis]|uniref:Uncharacterized protein n=1 Tax=Calycomorphotria hydatis TaxID=2528027 RepID=A0A517T8S3_9PLAN|nr:hypothetical protein V22_20080 [Calycomorphotria hydatis]
MNRKKLNQMNKRLTSFQRGREQGDSNAESLLFDALDNRRKCIGELHQLIIDLFYKKFEK